MPLVIPTRVGAGREGRTSEATLGCIAVGDEPGLHSKTLPLKTKAGFFYNNIFAIVRIRGKANITILMCLSGFSPHTYDFKI